MPLQPRLALALLAGLATLTIVEVTAASVAYRSTLTEALWADVEQGIEPGLTVLVGTPWLDPVARMHLPATTRPSSLAPPDLRGLPRYAVLSYRGDTSRIDQLARLSPELGSAEEERRQRFGPLVVTTYTQSGARHPLDRLEDHWKPGAGGAKLVVNGARCVGMGTGFSCKRGGLELVRAEMTLAEVDERVHRCVEAKLHDGALVTANIEGFTFGSDLHGHFGFPGMNARLRSDAPITVTLRRDAEVLTRLTFTDDQGWAPIDLPTTPGTGQLSLEIQGAVRGVWGRNGYDANTAHAVCFELRSFGEGEVVP